MITVEAVVSGCSLIYITTESHGFWDSSNYFGVLAKDSERAPAIVSRGNETFGAAGEWTTNPTSGTNQARAKTTLAGMDDPREAGQWQVFDTVQS